MTDRKSRLEINGRVYDAKSGEILNLSQSKSSVVRHRRVIDGIVRSNNRRFQNPVSEKIQAANVHVKSQKTRSLHPSVYNRHSNISKIKRFARTRQQSENKLINSAKYKRSKLITRHQAIAPVDQPKPRHVGDGIAPPMPVLKQKVSKNNIDQKRPISIERPEVVEDLQEISWFKRHLIPALSSFAALALLGGFLVYNSLPNLSMRVAASRAGFAASVPSYHPSGYSFGGPISYGPGRVVIEFNSSTDDRSYTVTERKSSWDSKSLLDNFVLDEAENYLTFEEHGLTVYLYDRSQATWVDEGIWYVIGGSAELNSEQLLKIAASL